MDVDRLRAHARALGFTPQDEVRWLEPGELLRTAIKVVLSSVFADYADRGRRFKEEVRRLVQETNRAGEQ